VVVKMRPDSHWEPPEARKLLVTSHKVAQVLDLPQWKAQEICHVLERVFYGDGQVRYRVTQASLDAFVELLEQGLSLSAAREVMWFHKCRGSLPPKGHFESALPMTTRRRRRRL
jgi:hypothetical protein